MGRWRSLDITDFRALRDFMMKHHFDLVIHLAALTKRRYGNLAFEEYFKVNTMGTENVLKAAQAIGAKVVFASTAAVYTPSKHPYVRSKRAAEEVCKRYEAIVARIFNAYGEGKGGGVIETFIKRALANQPLLVNSGHVRDFIYVDDVCRALWILARKAEPGFYDVGTGKGISIEYVAELVVNMTGSSSPIKIVPAEPSISVADVRPIRAMGFKPEMPFKKGLKLVIEYMAKTISQGAEVFKTPLSAT